MVGNLVQAPVHVSQVLFNTVVWKGPTVPVRRTTIIDTKHAVNSVNVRCFVRVFLFS